MSKKCELTGKSPLKGHKVSHANNKTKRKFLPNLCQVTLVSEKLNLSIKLRISADALRSVEHSGGLDNFLIKSNDRNLSIKARRLRKKIKNLQEAN